MASGGAPPVFPPGINLDIYEGEEYRITCPTEPNPIAPSRYAYLRRNGNKLSNKLPPCVGCPIPSYKYNSRLGNYLMSEGGDIYYFYDDNRTISEIDANGDIIYTRDISEPARVILLTTNNSKVTGIYEGTWGVSKYIW